jgi:hypothetical protein
MASSVGTMVLPHTPGSCDAVAVGFAGDMLSEVDGQICRTASEQTRDYTVPGIS